jgi:hypothetical protein
MSHEHREIIDDPFIFKATSLGPPLAWIDPFTGEESSDQCQHWFGPAKSNGVGVYNQVINGHPYLLQTDWSNALAEPQGLGCVQDGVDRAPTPAFTSNTKGATATFDGTTSSDPDAGDAISSYIWQFGDGTIGFGATPKHRYASAGTYPVRLQVIDGRGAAAITDNDVTVTSPTPTPTHSFQVKLTENLNGATFRTHGSGSATGMGKVTVDDFAFFDFTNAPVTYDVGEFFAALTNAKGDRLFYTYIATLTDVKSPPEGNDYVMSGHFVIEGGTGAFANATGSGTISGTCTSSFTRDDADCIEHWNGKTGGF